MIRKCSKLGYPRSGTVLGLKGQGHRVNKSILHTLTTIHRHSLGGITSRLRLRGCLVRVSLTFARWCNQSSVWRQTLRVPSSFLKLCLKKNHCIMQQNLDKYMKYLYQ